MVKDGKIIATNSVNYDLSKVELRKDLLDKIWLGTCTEVANQPSCSPPGGLFADFNMWDSFLDIGDLQDWTQCKNNQEVSQTDVHCEICKSFS